MNTYVNAYGMRMPARFADMTSAEMEYGGAGFWKKAKKKLKKVGNFIVEHPMLVVAAVGLVCGGVGVVGLAGVALGAGFVVGGSTSFAVASTAATVIGFGASTIGFIAELNNSL